MRPVLQTFATLRTPAGQISEDYTFIVSPQLSPCMSLVAAGIPPRATVPRLAEG